MRGSTDKFPPGHRLREACSSVFSSIPGLVKLPWDAVQLLHSLPRVDILSDL